jgi:hypothetical protein
MDEHLTYVGMTRHRDEATLYAGRDDFRNFVSLKERLSRARPKDSTLDYAHRRGIAPAGERVRNPEARQRRQHEPASLTQTELGPVERFRKAQREFIKVARAFDLDASAKARAAEPRREMKRNAQEIAKEPARMSAAEREGIAPQVRNFIRQAEREQGCEKARESRRMKGWTGKTAWTIQQGEPCTARLGDSMRPTLPSMGSTPKTPSGSSMVRF